MEHLKVENVDLPLHAVEGENLDDGTRQALTDDPCGAIQEPKAPGETPQVEGC